MAPKRQCYFSSWVVFDKITPGYNSSNGTAGILGGGGGGGGISEYGKLIFILFEPKGNMDTRFIGHGLYNDI